MFAVRALVGIASLGLLGSAFLLSMPAPEAAPPPRSAPVEQVYRLPDSEQVAIIHPAEQFAWPWASDAEDWGHKNIGLADAWKVNKGKGVLVAVLDTGCDTEHRDLKDQVSGGYDFTASRRTSWADVNGHGTHCAGVIAAAENGVGMVGVAPQAKLLIVKVLNDKGWGTNSQIANGIDFAVKHDADVISMSLGGGGADPVITAAVKRALAKGVIVVAAAGNDGPGGVGNPGNVPGVVCVAATDKSDAVASFSSRGKEVIVAAPGVDVRSCYPGDRFATMSGTSMATPYVAGCAALYVSDCKSRGVKATPEEFIKLVSATSKDLPPPGRDNDSGYGLVQPAKLLTAGKNPRPPINADRFEWTLPADHPHFLVGGRKVKRIIYEFEPQPK